MSRQNSGPIVDHTGIGSGSDLSTWATLRRGAALSPELTRGLTLTITLGLLSTLGRVLVPLVIQRTTDEGLLAPTGPDLGRVWMWVGIALAGVVVTAFSAYAVNVRLFTSSENGLAALRIRAFRHIHDLSMLTQNTERRGSLVSRVTSDVDTISAFVQFGGLMLVISIGQITLATLLMVWFSPVLAAVVWACFVPLFFLIRHFQGVDRGSPGGRGRCSGAGGRRLHRGPVRLWPDDGDRARSRHVDGGRRAAHSR